MNVATSLNSFTNVNFQVRFLTTIPSAAETSMLEEEASSAVSPAKEQDVVEPFYAILHSPQASTTPIRRQSIITLHPASEVLNNNNDKKVLENSDNELTVTAINITNDRENEINVSDVTKIDIMATNGICSENSIVGNSANDCSSSQKNGQVIPEAGTSS